MIEGLLYFSPLLVLLIAVLVLMFGEHEESEPYGGFRFSRVMILSSLALGIIFYNKPLVMGLSTSSKFAFFSESLLYAASLLILYISRKWFAAMQRTAYVFCGGICLTLMFAIMLVGSQNLALTTGSIIVIMLSNYILLAQSANKKEVSPSAEIYLIMMLTCGLCLCGGLLMFYVKCGALDYESLRAYIAFKSAKIEVWIAVMLYVIPFLFLLGLAPLHFGLTETLGQAVLPVFMYFMIMPVVAIWGGFVQLNINVFLPLLAYLKVFYMLAALLSVGIGAIGACCGQNIRKIFAYTATYNVGIVLLTLRRFTVNAVSSGYVYLMAYLLAMFGICVCLFGFKKKGEYLLMLSDFEGVEQKRTYIAVMMLIFMFSLLGFPPFIGFGGIFTALNYLALHHHFYQLLYLLIMMLVMGYAYLQIVRVMFFNERKNSFDRTDGSVYASVSLIMMVMILIVARPDYYLGQIRQIMETVLP